MLLQLGRIQRGFKALQKLIKTKNIRNKEKTRKIKERETQEVRILICNLEVWFNCILSLESIIQTQPTEKIAKLLNTSQDIKNIYKELILF